MWHHICHTHAHEKTIATSTHCFVHFKLYLIKWCNCICIYALKEPTSIQLLTNSSAGRSSQATQAMAGQCSQL